MLYINMCVFNNSSIMLMYLLDLYVKMNQLQTSSNTFRIQFLCELKFG